MAEDSIRLIGPGDPAPGFELVGTDGRRHALADYADRRAVLVVFTCNHCPYARAKIPLLNDIAEDNGSVAVIGINPNDDSRYPEDGFERMVELVEDGTVRYDAYLRDETQAVAKAYGAVCTPDPYLLAGDGDAFVLRYHGRLDDAHDPESEPTRVEIREAIEAVLDGDPVALETRPSRGCSIKWYEGNEPAYWNDL